MTVASMTVDTIAADIEPFDGMAVDGIAVGTTAIGTLTIFGIICQNRPRQVFVTPVRNRHCWQIGCKQRESLLSRFLQLQKRLIA